MMWMHDEVECPRIITARNLTVSNEVIMVGLATEQPYVSGSATLAKIDPQVIRKWALSISALHGKKEFINLR